jgi:hypothetical protein
MRCNAMRYELKYKVPVNFTFTIQKHLDSLTIYVKKPTEEVWREATIIKELIEFWGGMWRDCGGSRYKVVVKDEVTVADGEYSYQVCIPTTPSIQNYAMTSLRFITECDIKIETDRATYIFFVRYLNEFEM